MVWTTNGCVRGQQAKTGPLVSVLVSTFNRPAYLSEALAGVLRQTYRNLELIVVNDGGQDVSDIVGAFHDSRLIFINRKENRGKAFSLNEALSRANGKYVAYLDDDDLYYPNHIQALVDVLETQTDCGAAYSDLYKTYYSVMPDGRRAVLSKIVEISRDFDRFLMLYFNPVQHLCLMHRRDLIEKTGLYNERLNILIDWDMTRRLVFFTDFHHVQTITGEFYSSVGECDKVSIQKCKDSGEYLRNVLAIRTTRPAKPWPKLKDLSIIFVPENLDKQAGQTLDAIWRNTFYPYKLYLPLARANLAWLNNDMPNIVPVLIEQWFCQAERTDAALAKAEGEYVGIVTGNLPIEEMWIEHPLYALINSGAEHEGFELVGSNEAAWGVVVRKTDLESARRDFPGLSERRSLEAAGISLRKPRDEKLPFQFDDILQKAQSAQQDGNWVPAARLFQQLAQRHQNDLWMKTLAASAFYEAGNREQACKLCHEVNHHRATVDTLLLEAKIDRGRKRFGSAIGLLKTAEQILAGEWDSFIDAGMGVSL